MAEKEVLESKRAKHEEEARAKCKLMSEQKAVSPAQLWLPPPLPEDTHRGSRFTPGFLEDAIFLLSLCDIQSLNLK